MNYITIVILGIFVFLSSFSNASEYPKSKLEREMDDMGSILGGEGVVFRPRKEKSTSTKAQIGNVNKYLFQASLEVLKFAPLASADSQSGTIITEWYDHQEQKDTQFKVMVYIKDDTISPEGLEVIAFERTKSKNQMPKSKRTSAISSVLEDKIIRRARALYLKSSR
jgi:hypothetical protein